ncbi:Crp/Fnr family transcriptional regulator [Dyadobacter pollutisoli]|jgi:CRP/FNR family transcriptional regulator|uniref:Crp/Fnr family transcriptional regulator n=1 Tax=Dyadobacter pollutisoli TaxID=2910158 RepID=A0A9E8SL74_9BACT|nr:Crp/Fnr family transcriptional regulator [Dyadobacter pollutisoli]WAC11521.1 Crp/Fnr family transcriptional regulator [Dyadobacter pollutisoli]
MEPNELLAKLPVAFAEPELRQEMSRHGKYLVVGKGDTIVREGQYLDFLPIVLKGEIRVFQQKEDREILLYYVRAGQTCMMSLSAAYFSNTSVSYGVATEPSEIFVFPTRMVSEWQLKYPSWNSFLIQTFRSRYEELLGSFESVAFDPIEKRVMTYLANRSRQESTTKIVISHQQLAYELGTTRVVISRILKGFEQHGKLNLFRGYIRLK